MPKNKKLALNSGIQTYQILTNEDEVCIPSLSSSLSCNHVSFNYTISNDHENLCMSHT